MNFIDIKKTLVLLFLLSTTLFCSNKLIWGIKGSISIEKISLIESFAPKSENFPEYAYPIGYSVGFFSEYIFSEKFSVLTELIFQKSIKEITMRTWTGGILEHKFYSHEIRLFTMFKYRPIWLTDMYFFGGPGLGYIINSRIDYYDKFYQDKKQEYVTDHYPTFDAMIGFGLGREVNIKNITFVLELAVNIGLTKFNYFKIGTWKNSGLNFSFGVNL